MAYSSIVKKKCKCGCEKYPTISFDGYYYAHAPQEIKNRQGLKAKRGYQNKLNKAKANNLSKKVKSFAKGEDAFRDGGKTELDKWYDYRRKEMVGCCIECGRGTNKNNDKYFTWSICHIVPKSLVPAVAKHEYNWVELCQLHHQEFDNTFDRAAAMVCFSEVYQKFQLFKHLIPAEQLRKVNPHLLT